MPKLLSVNPTGYFSYGIHGTVLLDAQGTILLKGNNIDRGGTDNGAGKTSLFNVITQILFGKNPSGETGEAVINEFLGKTFGRIVFLDDDGEKWRITEVKKWRKTDKYPDAKLDDNYVEEPSQIHAQGMKYSGTDVYLERWDGQIWVDERSTNSNVGDVRLDLKATRKKVVEVLGMGYEQFMSIAYMAQQETLKFINGTHKEKLEVLSDLCDLNKWNARVAAVREKQSELESEKLRIQSNLEGLRRAGATMAAPDENQKVLWETMIADYLEKIADCDTQIVHLQKEKNAWQDNIAQLDLDLAARIKELRETTLNKETTRNQLDQIAREYSTKCQEIRERPRDVQISILETEISETRGQVMARRFDLEQLMTGSGKCNRCRTNVTIEHIIRQRELLQLEIGKLEEKVDTQTEKLEGMVQAWQDGVKKDLDLASEEYQSRREDVDLAISVIDTMIDTLNRNVESIRTQRAQMGDNPQYRIDAVAQKRLLFLSEKTRCDEKARNWHEQKKKHDEYKSLILEAEARLLQYDDELKYLTALDKLFGDKGIKAYKLNNLLNLLNHTLKEYVDIITDGAVNLWVTQYREKSDGDMTADIQIIVREGQKKETPFNLYSGGERQQIMLAFIGAFWQIASQYGAGINTLFLDEILGPLDDVNAEKVFNFLDHMRSKGKSTILIVTHNQNIKNQISFDQIWTVVKKDYISTLTYV